MGGIPENADDMYEFMFAEVLHGIEVTPREANALRTYMQDRHNDLFGPWTTYFVLGSYETPFKYRLDTALDELNRRVDSYAYFLVTQEDISLPDNFPWVKFKFYLHAVYADYIATILEHNTGGALTEFGRLDRAGLLDRTWVFPRGWETLYGDADVFDTEVARAQAIEHAYAADSAEALSDALADIIDEATDNDIQLTETDLREHLKRELGRRRPDYSGLVTDGFAHYDRLGQYEPWTLETDLRDVISELPRD